MAASVKANDPVQVQLDAYVLPSDHRVFKLFPGRRYRLSHEVKRSSTAFLDIRGLDALGADPLKWSDDDLRRIISQDRILQSSGSKIHKKPTVEDSRRLGFLKGLLLEAKLGDLVAVPLGKGLDGDVAIGQFQTAPGVIEVVDVIDGDSNFKTYGRKVKWLSTVKRRRFSNTLNKSLHAPMALHYIEQASREEIYLAAYGSFTYDDIYVALFPSEKEKFTTQDQALIGLWFNSMAVVHRRMEEGVSIPASEDLLELALEESSISLELARNSPLSAILRTTGPTAFAMLALYTLASEAVPLSKLKNVSVVAKPVAGATDKCKVDVPPELALIAKGLGHGRWDTTCRVNKRVQSKATLKSTSELKIAKKGPN